MSKHPNSSASIAEGRTAVIDRILVVTGEEARRVGPERIRMGEIAARADVSRASLYRYFASKDDLIRAYTMRELDTLFEAIDDAAIEAEDFDEQITDAFALALNALRHHKVFGSVLEINDRGIMRSTLQSGEAIAHARDLSLDRMNRSVLRGRVRIDQFDAAIAGELMTRLLISLVETPETVARLESTEDAREFARRYMVPLVNALATAPAVETSN
jgi:AcrR family transcriptional regulator